MAQSSSLSLVSLLVPLVAGLYWKRATERGAVAAIVLGMTAWLVAEYLESDFPPILYSLAASTFGMGGGRLWKSSAKSA